MHELLAFFSPFYLWVIAAISLAMVQFLFPGRFNLLIFAAGCLVAAVSGLYLKVLWQPLFFLGGSLTAYLISRHIFQRQKGPGPLDPASLINQVGYVLETVTLETGSVHVAGQRWLARNQRPDATPIDIGKPVTVTEVEGNTLLVEATSP